MWGVLYDHYGWSLSPQVSSTGMERVLDEEHYRSVLNQSSVFTGRDVLFSFRVFCGWVWDRQSIISSAALLAFFKAMQMSCSLWWPHGAHSCCVSRQRKVKWHLWLGTENLLPATGWHKTHPVCFCSESPAASTSCNSSSQLPTAYILNWKLWFASRYFWLLKKKVMFEGQVADSYSQGWCTQKQSGQASLCMLDWQMLSALRTATEKKLSKLLLKVKARACRVHKKYALHLALA